MRAWNYGLIGPLSISGRITTVSRPPQFLNPNHGISADRVDTIQRSIAVDPDAVRSTTSSDDGETAAIIMQLRQKLKSQTEEVTQLQSKLSNVHSEHQKEVSPIPITGIFTVQ